MNNATLRAMRSARAFTLIELIMVIAILGILATLLTPQVGQIRERAESTKCVGNLRGIGTAVANFAADNNNEFPYIEPNPSDPVYPDDLDARPILEVLGDYGLTENELRCPSDLRGDNYFARAGTSYQWRPIVDGDSLAAPAVLGRRGVRYPNSSRLVLATDFQGVHHGKLNRLFANGAVRQATP